MKKKLISSLLIMMTAICLISCGSNEKKTESNPEQEASEECSNESTAVNDENDKGDKENKEKKSSDSKEKSGDKKKSESNKEVYKKKLDDIQKGLSDLNAKKSGSNLEMKQAAKEEYDRWDSALNEIYGVLKKELKADEMHKLEQEEQNWIKEKEEKAKREGEKYKGGTNEGLAHASSLAESTKNRCYELVDKYMK